MANTLSGDSDPADHLRTSPLAAANREICTPAYLRVYAHRWNSCVSVIVRQLVCCDLSDELRAGYCAYLPFTIGRNFLAGRAVLFVALHAVLVRSKRVLCALWLPDVNHHTRTTSTPSSRACMARRLCLALHPTNTPKHSSHDLCMYMSLTEVRTAPCTHVW